jgi:hypothetical protein
VPTAAGAGGGVVLLPAAAAFFLLRARRGKRRLAELATARPKQPPPAPPSAGSQQTQNKSWRVPAAAAAEAGGTDGDGGDGGGGGDSGGGGGGGDAVENPLASGAASGAAGGAASSGAGGAASASFRSVAVAPRSALGATLGAGGLGASPQLASALQRVSTRSLAVAAAAPKKEAAPVIVAGVLLHAQATKAGRENAEVGLPPGWAAVWSASRAVWYWRNNDSGEVAWEKPRKAGGLLGADDAPHDPAAAAEADAKADLPPGWAAVWSRSKSRWYWRRGDETLLILVPRLRLLQTLRQLNLVVAFFVLHLLVE